MRHAIPAALLTTSLAGAQVTAKLESGPADLRVDACGVKTFPKGRDLGTKFSLAAACSGAGRASYETTITAGPSLEIIGSSKPNYSPMRTCSTGPNEVILTWTSATKVSGFLRVVAKGSAGPGGQISQTVDLGDDGKIEFSASTNTSYPKWADFPVTIDSKGLRIGIVTSSSQGYHRWFPTTKGTLTVSFLRTRWTCDLTKFGTGCGATGPQLSASQVDPWGNVFLTHSGGLPSKLGVMAVGLKSLDIPLPSSGCRQHTDLLILQFLTLPPYSTRYWFRVPQNLKGFARVQFFAYHAPNGVLDVRSTNGLLLTCR